MVSPIERLSRRLAGLEDQVRGLARTPQLAYSSIEDGSVDEYDAGGNLVQVIGKQWDGTHGAFPVTGPIPPVPTAPIVTGGLSLNVGWDGTFAGPDGVRDILITAPMDFARVEIHASKTSGFSADTADTLLDTIESPRGGTRPAMLPEGRWYVVLVARSSTGKRSAQSAESSAVVTPPVGSDVDVDKLREEFAAADEALRQAVAENRVLQDALAGEVTALRETALPALESELAGAGERLDTAAGQLDKLTGAAPLPQVYAEHIASGTAAFQRVDIKNLFVTEGAQLNTLTAQRIAANVASFLSVTTDQLTAGKAALGEAVARKFAAETGAFMKLYANQVFIGEGGNLVPDAGFLDAEGWGKRTLAGGGRNGNNALEIPASATQSGVYYGIGDRNRQFAVVPGGTYKVSVWVKSDTAVPANSVSVYMKWTNPSTAVSGAFTTPGNISNTAAIPANTWTPISGSLTVGAAASRAFIGLYTQATANTRVLFSEPLVQSAVTPSLIVDGFFQGLRVIGASVESNAATGRGVKFNDNGLVAYDSAGRETVRLDGANSILTGATIRTAAAGARWQMSTAGLEAWDAAGKRYLLGDANGLQLTGTVTTEASVETSAGVFTKTLASLTAGALNRAGVLAEAPGVWGTRDGRSLGGFGFLTSGNFEGAMVYAPDVQIEGAKTAAVDAPDVVIGNNNTGSRHNVDLRGNVSHNGVPLRSTEVFKFTGTGSKTPANAADQAISALSPTALPGETYTFRETNPQFIGPGILQVYEDGFYIFNYQMMLGRAVEARSFINIADSAGTGLARTGISIGEDQGTSVAAGVPLKAGDTVRFAVYQQTGMTVQYRATITVVRLP